MDAYKSKFFIRLIGVFAIASGIYFSIPTGYIKENYALGIEIALGQRCLPIRVGVIKLKEKNYHRGDFVYVHNSEIFTKYFPALSRAPYVGKIIMGIEGDTIKIIGDDIYRNDIKIGKYSRLQKAWIKEKHMAIKNEIKISKGELFLMSTSPNAADSRLVGVVPASDIYGKGYAIF